MFKRLRWKLTATYLGLVFLSMVILGVCLLNNLENYFYENLQTRLQTQVLIASRFVENNTLNWNLAQMEKLSEEISSDLGARVTIIDAAGKVLGDSEENASQMENHLNRPEILEAKEKGMGTSTRYSSTLNIDLMYVAGSIVIDNKIIGFMRIALPLTETKNAFLKLWSSALMAILLTILFTTPIGLTLSKKITEPIEKLTEMAQLISHGKFNYKAKIKNKDEIGELAKALNNMSKTINEKIDLISEGKNKLETVLSSMTSGIIFINKEGQVELVNPAAEKFLSILGKNITGLPCDIALGHQELSSKILDAVKNKQLVEQEIKLSYPEETFVKVLISPILDNSGNSNGAVAVLHDITQIQKLEKMRRDFVANVSHELKTPVTAIKGFTETLLDGALHDKEACKEFVEIIDREADRLKRLIQDLLDLSRIEAKQITINLKPKDISGIIRDTTVKLQRQIKDAGLSINLNLPEQPIIIELDCDMIEQVLVNLIDNAVKYTPSGGKIEIEVVDKKQDVIVLIHDTGIGIPNSDLNRVFERFYRVDKARSREQGGTGLGLSIVKHIIDFHGGTVGVNSKPGKGSSFFFTLPKIHSKK